AVRGPHRRHAGPAVPARPEWLQWMQVQEWRDCFSYVQCTSKHHIPAITITYQGYGIRREGGSYSAYFPCSSANVAGNPTSRSPDPLKNRFAAVSSERCGNTDAARSLGT